MPGIEDLVAQLYRQRAMQTMADSDAGANALAQQLQARRANTIQQVSEQDRMPVYRRNDELNRSINGNDIAADVERGNAILPQRLQGMGPADINEAYNLGNKMRAYGGDPTLQYMEPNQRAAPALLGTPLPQDPDSARVERARLLDEAAQVNGGQLPAEYLQDLPQAQAIQNLVDQLNARREALGANPLGAYGAMLSQPI